MSKDSHIESSPSPFRKDEGTFHKVVRLKTGEAILCTMETDIRSIASEPYLTMVKPVQAIMSKQMLKDENIVGEVFVLRPWVGLSDSREFVIPTDIVLTVGDMKYPVKKQYEEYLVETERAERVFKEEREQELMNNAIYKLLTQVANGGKVYILRDDDQS